jgi:putative ABC transport system ATP-binding protein
MLIELQNLIPEPIPQEIVEASEVWGTNLRIETNSNVLVSAQSGMGKSTLLHVIYGLRKDYSGQVLMDANIIREHSYEEWKNLRKQSISMVFQDLRLFPHLTAQQNLELIPEVNTSTPSIEEMTAQLGVDNCLNQPVSTLSHGQRQRMAIIRALRKPFRLLLLDEPFSHLDEENQKHASRLVQEVTEANDAGLILSSLGPSPALSFDQQISL